jgi:aryl-alcohol dehydrogenase-like predicted oxidoreductase
MTGVDRLCFGTSTFAAGRLMPDKDSRPGIAALAAALTRGVQLIHSNPNLGTQWAVREAVEAAGRPLGVRHLIKVQLPADVGQIIAVSVVEAAFAISAAELSNCELHAAVIEIDLKRTANRGLLADVPAVTAFYQMVAETAVNTGVVSTAYGFCHSPAHLAACLRAEAISGYSAQYNQVEAWPALYLDGLGATNRPFIAVAPLWRGRLVNTRASLVSDRLHALRWVLGHPAVSFATVTMSSPGHVAEVLDVAETPLLIDDVRRHAQSWKAACAPSTQRPAVIIR